MAVALNVPHTTRESYSDVPVVLNVPHTTRERYGDVAVALNVPHNQTQFRWLR